MLEHTTRTIRRRPIRYRRYSSQAASLADSPSKLPGTVPPHGIYVFLHSSVLPMQAESRIESALRVTLQRQLLPARGIVNFSWAQKQAVYLSQDEEKENYKATAYSRAGGRLHLDEVTADNLEYVVPMLHKHARGELGDVDNESKYAIDMYVCTHKERDCRCGEHGYTVVQALRKEVKKRKRMDPEGAARRVRLVGETTHVGGHKYAANVLVYPHGDWLGNVRPENVPSILDAVLGRPLRPSLEEDELPLLPQLWRGRMGLSSDQQLSLYEKFVTSGNSEL